MCNIYFIWTTNLSILFFCSVVWATKDKPFQLYFMKNPSMQWCTKDPLLCRNPQSFAHPGDTGRQGGRLVTLTLCLTNFEASSHWQPSDAGLHLQAICQPYTYKSKREQRWNGSSPFFQAAAEIFFQSSVSFVKAEKILGVKKIAHNYRRDRKLH